MTGSRAFMVERERQRRAHVREVLAERRGQAPASDGTLRLPRATLWFSRTIGTQEALWLLRAPDGRTYRAEVVSFVGETRLLSDVERELLPDKPSGVVDAEHVEAFGWEELP